MARHPLSNRAELHSGHRSVAGGLARASVFGVSDGLVSNISLIIGFAGSGVDGSVVRLAGLAGAIAGAASMAAGEWVSVSAQNDLVRHELEVERRELMQNPAAETEELAEIYQGHGMSADSARTAAAEVMTQPDVALGVHAREELGVDPDSLASPWAAAGLSLVCFLFGALLPVVPWHIGSGHAASLASVLIGVVAAALVGMAVGRFAGKSLTWAATRQVLILLLACGVTYLVGSLLHVTVS